MPKKNSWGLLIFMVALGMFISLFIPNVFIESIIIIILLILGYNLYCL
ncbi:MAG: hypothetical protein QM697_09390 [Lachnospiraceae bacterium]